MNSRFKIPISVSEVDSTAQSYITTPYPQQNAAQNIISNPSNQTDVQSLPPLQSNQSVNPSNDEYSFPEEQFNKMMSPNNNMGSSCNPMVKPITNITPNKLPFLGGLNNKKPTSTSKTSNISNYILYGSIAALIGLILSGK